jgi:GH25 family lysozyme M1 (1,4-beta-N-acetylmuramidase)
MIDENKYAFGIDISHYDSNNGLMDFGVVAEHKPRVSFIAARAGISWGYQDPKFPYHWEEIGKMERVGRMAYHVLYPGESAQAQADNLFRILGDTDWTHSNVVIDWELVHDQSKRTITNCIESFAEICKQRIGRYPILYTRRLLLTLNAIPAELTHLDLWLAQYKWSLPYPLYTPEYEPPPDTDGLHGWLIQQTGDKGKPIGVTGNKHYMDYDRWNGGEDEVMKYFGFDEETPPVLTLEERVADLEKRVKFLEDTGY